MSQLWPSVDSVPWEIVLRMMVFFRLETFSESLSAAEGLLIVNAVNSARRPTIGVGPGCCWLSRC